MVEAKNAALALVAAGVSHSYFFDLQLFASDDPELGDPLEIDVDALGDDVGKLKSMLGKALGENKKIRGEAGRRRTALRAVEQERDGFKTQLETANTEKTDLATKIETANRANGQHKSNFKTQLVDRALRDALTAAGALDVDVVMQAMKRDKIECNDDTFEVTGAKEAVDAFKTEKAVLFGAAPKPKPTGTGNGAGPTGSGTGGDKPAMPDYRDTSKTLEQLERESNLAQFGRATIGGGA